MIVDRYDPMNLFEMVPKLELEFEPELVELDRLLEDDELFELVKADLLRACADRLATFHTCRFSERLSGLFITH